MFAPDTRILILDDMMTMRKIVGKTLRDAGFKDIQEAADGNIGWEILDKASPQIQLVISDWNMPNCSGLELLKKVRADVRFGAVPFMLLTAEAEATQIKEAVAQKVSGYMIKPFTPEALKEKILQLHQRLSAPKAA